MCLVKKDSNLFKYMIDIPYTTCIPLLTYCLAYHNV